VTCLKGEDVYQAAKRFFGPTARVDLSIRGFGFGSWYTGLCSSARKRIEAGEVEPKEIVGSVSAHPYEHYGVVKKSPA